MRLRELFFGGILAAVGLGAALLTAEVGVRALHLVPDRFWQPDPRLGVTLIPGKQGWWTQEEREFVVPVQINSHGFRDVERGLDKPEGTFRIVVLGDSFVEAMHVPLEVTFFRRLEEELNRSSGANGRRFEVLGTGVSGYGTAAQLLFLKEMGERLRPDLVLLSVYPGNDIKNNSPSLEDTLRPEYSVDGDVQRIVSRKKAQGGGRGPRSKAYQYFRQLVLTRQPGLARRLVKLGLVRREALPRPPLAGGIPVDFGVYDTVVSPEWLTAWEHTERLLASVEEESRRLGAAFRLMVVSTRERVYPDSWQRILAATPAMQERTWDLEAPARRLLAWCEARSVACLDLHPSFAAAAGKEPPLHFPLDGHWTSAGHELAAGQLARFLRLAPETQQEGAIR